MVGVIFLVSANAMQQPVLTSFFTEICGKRHIIPLAPFFNPPVVCKTTLLFEALSPQQRFSIFVEGDHVLPIVLDLLIPGSRFSNKLVKCWHWINTYTSYSEKKSPQDERNGPWLHDNTHDMPIEGSPAHVDIISNVEDTGPNRSGLYLQRRPTESSNRKTRYAKKKAFAKKRAGQKEKEILAVNRRPEQNTVSFPREKGSTQTRILFLVLIFV